MGFCHDWRPYQAEALKSFERFLEDKHIHIVAAPGSGKTVLGLELVKRLGEPALILSPSLSIVHQWIERVGDFSETQEVYAQFDQSGELYCSTYQQIFQYYKRGADAGIVGEGLQSVANLGIKTLVFDEAHHLKREWYVALNLLKSLIPGCVTIALTATLHGMRRISALYILSCGEIDYEVETPS